MKTKWTIWGLILLILLCPGLHQASAQIAHDQTQTGSTGSAAFVWTTSDWTPSGSNLVIIAKISYRNSTDRIDRVRWIKSGGLSTDMVYLRDDVNGDARSAIYYLANPIAEERSILVNFSTSVRAAISGSSYTGVDQTTPFSSNAGNNGTDASPTVTVTSSSDEMVIDALAQVSAGPDAATAAHTERANLAATGGGTDTRHASQEKLNATTMSWSMGDSDNWAISSGTLAAAVSEWERRFWGRRRWW